MTVQSCNIGQSVVEETKTANSSKLGILSHITQFDWLSISEVDQ